MKKIYLFIIVLAVGYIASAQNVGISTPAPKYRFHLSGGSDNAPVTFGLGFSDLYGEPILKFVPAATNYLSFGFSNGSSVTGNIAEGLVLTRTGFVGIGNATPQHPLSVGPPSSDAQGVTFRSYGDHGASWKGSGAFGYTTATVILGELNGKAHIGGHNPNLTAWADLYINEGPGGVGIGVSSITSGYKLDVGGPAKFNGQMDLSGYKIINVATPTAGTDAVNKDYVDNTVTGNDDWDKTGNNLYPKNPTTTNVGIGTTTPTGKLQVAGSHAEGVMQDGNDRPSIGITGVYPQMVMMTGNLINNNHGPTIMLGGYDNGGTSGNHKHWSIGTAQNSTFLDIGYHGGSDLNPHAGIRNYNGTTFMSILNNGNVGISNLNPTFRMDVNGGVRATDRFYGRYFLWDTRNDNFGPDNYNNELALEFKIASVIGASGSTYGGLMTIAPWGDNSGGLHHQLFFNDGGIGYRTGSPDNTTWNGWGRLLTTAGGTNDYVPKFNGTGSLVNSPIYANSTNVGIGTNAPDPKAKLHIMGSDIGGTNIVNDGNDRPSFMLEGTYPHLVIKASGNSSHGGTMSFWNFDGANTLEWNMGTGANGNFSLDYAVNESNPHVGLDNYGGPSTLHITPSGSMNLTGNYVENGVDLVPSTFCVIVPVNSGCPAGWVARDVRWDTEDINNADYGDDGIIAVDEGFSGSIRMRFCCRNW